MRKNTAEKNYSVSQFNRVCWFCQKPIKKGQKYIVQEILDWGQRPVAKMYYHLKCWEILSKMVLEDYGTESSEN
jgi:hypothetical protein